MIQGRPSMVIGTRMSSPKEGWSGEMAKLTRGNSPVKITFMAREFSRLRRVMPEKPSMGLGETTCQVIYVMKTVSPL